MVPATELTPEQILAKPPVDESAHVLAKNLPLICSGCGALSQTAEPGQAGYYDLKRRAVREYVTMEEEKAGREAQEEDAVVEAALQNLGEEKLKELGLDPRSLRYGEELESNRPVKGPTSWRVPLCDRCHRLVHHHEGEPIYHPSIDSLRETIEESPFKKNYIYHIIDAADFPMSFIPKLHMLLDANLKHRNRRNKAGRYYRDRMFNIDFVITRSDLLAPQAEMVDRMMPYMREVLRRSLGKFGKLVTLGNVSCVSAKRGWWTKPLKDKIYKRGGAGWMVGKVNVGKSQLFDAVFPKGTTADISLKTPINISLFAKEEDGPNERYVTEDVEDDMRLDETSMLPPVRPETNYPEMPTVSTLPGTTASPIRIPFGNGKGELIDLPGVARSNLENYVKPEHRSSLVMESRIKPQQHSLNTKQSLILGGGLIRITPKTPGLVFLAYNFTPLPEHKTSTEKAIEFQAETREAPLKVEKLTIQGIGETIKLAGTFKLNHDVTKERSGPLTRKDVANMKVEDLPWRVLATDILIEGCGWIEIVAQVRTRHLFDRMSSFPAQSEPESLEEPEPEPESEAVDPFLKMEQAAEQHAVSKEKPKPAAEPEKPEPNWPVVEVYSPEGKFIGERLPMNAWLINKPPKKDIKARPRKSMKGAKKAAKQAKRAAAAS
ncbi:Genetic interactor of prohibitins 3 [Colletotrichum sp. SAR11_239]|nr:Genetic interactor of prohibitins 3 [Colletotrichum sp. SAR11_239]